MTAEQPGDDTGLVTHHVGRGLGAGEPEDFVRPSARTSVAVQVGLVATQRSPAALRPGRCPNAHQHLGRIARNVLNPARLGVGVGLGFDPLRLGVRTRPDSADPYLQALAWQPAEALEEGHARLGEANTRRLGGAHMRRLPRLRAVLVLDRRQTRGVDFSGTNRARLTAALRLSNSDRVMD